VLLAQLNLEPHLLLARCADCSPWAGC